MGKKGIVQINHTCSGSQDTLENQIQYFKALSVKKNKSGVRTRKGYILGKHINWDIN